MRIFVTGSTGYIGSAVTRALLRAGHAVTGLARSGAKAARLRADGMTPVFGDLNRPETYLGAAGRCEAVVHCGFQFGAEAAATDAVATTALAELVRSGAGPRRFVYTSGTWVLGPRGAEPQDEGAAPNPPAVVAWRPDHERYALSAADGPSSAAVIRPGCVYGEHGGLYGLMLKALYDDRVVPLIGGGENAWASVYLDDLADLYRLVVERAPKRALYHATDGSADSVASVAEALIDAAGGGETLTVPLERARRDLGSLADALAMDQRVASARAREELGWKPMVGSAALNPLLLLSEWNDKGAGLAVA
ncbi:MAG: NAD-dependent epimerase/dehydratase family protein [Elusimicrobia bacterium]|nr:NAD-dependent epimerase/dehydratase family protein [Elusimicrobiota bacterium]